MMTSPLIHRSSDARYSGWPSAGDAPAYIGTQICPTAAPPNRFRNPRSARTRRASPGFEVKRLKRMLPHNLVQPDAVAKSP